jgi:hypothetical protein
VLIVIAFGLPRIAVAADVPVADDPVSSKITKQIDKAADVAPDVKAKPIGKPAKAAVKPTRLEREAQTVFKKADADQDQSLDKKEQVKSEKLAHAAIQKLVGENVVGGVNKLPSVEEPDMTDDAMSLETFTQHFEALAYREDEKVRDQRVQRNRPVVVIGRNNNNSDYARDEYRDRDLSRRERELRDEENEFEMQRRRQMMEQGRFNSNNGSPPQNSAPVNRPQQVTETTQTMSPRPAPPERKTPKHPDDPPPKPK